MFAENLKRPLWVAQGAMENGVRVYGTPVLHRWNWQPMRSDADIKAFGPAFVDYRKAVMANKELDNIKRFDRVWMDVEPSNPADPFASDADFFVYSVDKGAGGTGRVFFKRLSPDGD
jgi:hypothetical protein